MLLNLNFSMVPINLSMSITFVNLHGLSMRIACIRSITPSSANDFTLVGANINSQFFVFPCRPTGPDIHPPLK